MIMFPIKSSHSEHSLVMQVRNVPHYKKSEESIAFKGEIWSRYKLIK